MCKTPAGGIKLDNTFEFSKELLAAIAWCIDCWITVPKGHVFQHFLVLSPDFLFWCLACHIMMRGLEILLKDRQYSLLAVISPIGPPLQWHFVVGLVDPDQVTLPLYVL